MRVVPGSRGRDDGGHSMTEDTRDISGEEILTKKQLAERLQVSPRTIDYLHPPCLDLGYRSKRYVWSKVLKFLEERGNAA